MHVLLSLSLHYYVLYLHLNSCDGNDAFWRHSMLMKQSSFFSRNSRKHRTLSLQICVQQTVWLTTKFADWCRNVCTLYKRLSVTPAAVTSDLMQRLIDTWGSMSQNVIDKAVGQWRKAVTCKHEGKMISLWTSPNWNRLFSEPTHTQPALLRCTNSLPRKTRYFTLFLRSYT